MPAFNPAALILLGLALAGGLVLLGVLRVRYDEGLVAVNVGRADRPVVTADFRDAWLLLLLALGLGWSVTTALDRSGWVPGTDRLVPAILIATLLAWLFALGARSRARFLLLTAPSLAASLLLLTPFPVRGRPALVDIQGMAAWLFRLVVAPQFAVLVGLLALALVTGAWTSWWIFRRRNGLAALLPSGTILAVEILNDANPGLYFLSAVWLASAMLLLLRLNFVSLKERWRVRRLPRAADAGWNFGEMGFEATALLLVVAFLLPPLTSEDVSNVLVPSGVRATQFHPFGLGIASVRSGPLDIGYSETVRPGFQLKAKPHTVMSVSGELPAYYPYWRGIALGAWDGIRWTPLPASFRGIPLEVKPLPPKTPIPRNDLPQDPELLELVHSTFRIAVPPEQLNATVFTAGEAIWIDKHATEVRGTAAGPSRGTAFDLVDRVRLADNPRPPYDYVVYQAIPSADVKSLREAPTTYPTWVEPYRELYVNGRIASGYSTERDREIADLAARIVRDAGARTVYDQTKAIEAWFLDSNRFSYTLTPPQSPPGVRPLDYFLFSSHKGYCQDFSTAMAVMLRSLHIPVRQMSGFGQGNFDEKTRVFTVSSTDAHTWVEVYFPGDGWIPFEPTPDGVNAPVERPATAGDTGAPPSAAAPGVTRERTQNPGELEGGDIGGGRDRFSRLRTGVLAGAAVLLLAILLTLLLFGRWLMGARDMPRIWRRLRFLGDRLQVPRRPGDTPNEYGARLAEAVPLHRQDLRALARLYTRARFRRSGLTAGDQVEARQAWDRVRRSYPRLVARAWGARLAQGRSAGRITAAEAPGSRSHGQARRR